MASTTLIFEQENENGNYQQYRKTFRNQEEKMTWIKDMRNSSHHLHKHFRVIQLEA